MEADSYLQENRINLADEELLVALIRKILLISDHTERVNEFNAILETFGGKDDTLRA